MRYRCSTCSGKMSRLSLLIVDELGFVPLSPRRRTARLGRTA